MVGGFAIYERIDDEKGDEPEPPAGGSGPVSERLIMFSLLIRST